MMFKNNIQEEKAQDTNYTLDRRIIRLAICADKNKVYDPPKNT